MALNRRKEREIVYQMLFASQFYPEEETASVFDIMIEQMEEGAAVMLLPLIRFRVAVGRILGTVLLAP